MPAGTITLLQVQERDKERVNVFLDGAFAIGISLRTMESAGLFKGRQLSEQDFVQIEELEQADRAYEAALHALEARPRSEREMRDRLRRKGHPDDHIDKALGRLRDLGLIDDAAFARFWVENRQANRPRGAQALRQELRKKGVDRDTISETVAAATNPDDERERALEVARAALRRFAKDDRPTFRRRMGSFLQRRGFGFDAIKPAVATLWAELNDEPSDDDDLDEQD